MDKENKLILYKDEDGRVSINTRFADEDVWLSQEQLAEIYQTTQENVSMHISNIFSDGELDKERTYKKFLLVRQEGNRHVRRNIDHSGRTRNGSIRPAGDGSFLCLAYSMDTGVAPLESGPLMDIELAADEALDAGKYTVRVEHVVCATRDNKSVAMTSTVASVTVEKDAEEAEPAVVTGDDVEGRPAGRITMPIFLNNRSEVGSFYFDLTLPKGIVVAEDDYGQIEAKLVGKYANGTMLLMVQPWQASMGETTNMNTWRFTAIPLDESTFPVGAGRVMDITLYVVEDMTAGVYTARLNVVGIEEEEAGSRSQASAEGTKQSWTSYPTITIKADKPGDVNGDYVVDVADIATVINVMAGGTDGDVRAPMADVNGDGVVDVADIATIINEMAARARMKEANVEP